MIRTLPSLTSLGTFHAHRYSPTGTHTLSHTQVLKYYLERSETYADIH